MIDLESYPSARFWMRYVPFVVLRDLVKLLQNYPDGLAAKDIVVLVQNNNMFFVKGVKGKRPPQLTTIYHYRNALLHLDILIRDKRELLKINTTNDAVINLLINLGEGKTLSEVEKKAFGELVIRQADCKAFFADFFFPFDKKNYSLDEWTANAVPVIWREDNSIEHVKKQKGDRKIHLLNYGGYQIAELNTENHIQAILYGLKYWWNELSMLDELFREDVGNVMFPILPASYVSETQIIKKFLEYLKFENEWARISLRELAFALCIELRISRERLFSLIQNLYRRYPGYFVLIPTSSSFATFTATSRYRENYELKNYFKDDQGIYISHLRIHQRVKESLA